VAGAYEASERAPRNLKPLLAQLEASGFVEMAKDGGRSWCTGGGGTADAQALRRVAQRAAE
jgi:hypothetical protein